VSSLPPVDLSLAARLIAEQFPQWSQLPLRAVEPGGWDNRTFRLGDELSLRLPSAAGYVAQVTKEQTWLPRLGAQLSVPIPTPLALGQPGAGYPWEWSVYRWLPGEAASFRGLAAPVEFAREVAAFLHELQALDVTGGPTAGQHNFFRGGLLAVYDAETRAALDTLGERVDAQRAREVWEAGLAAPFRGPPVWVHGDLSAANLLLVEGRLGAVIDFGCLGVGDPACDLVLAWTLFRGESRSAFVAAAPADSAMWARARCWALWKALITLQADPKDAAVAARIACLLDTEEAD